jgi:putative ABC transport system ATP-binding protein
MLRMDNVRKSFSNGEMSVEVLHGIDLEINDGELVAIMGASGCGKSTLLGILGTLDQATSGDYEINGDNVNTFSQKRLNVMRNENIGYVFQKFYLFEHKTAIENVMMPFYYSKNISYKEGHKRATEILEKVHLGNKMSCRPSILSGGECQRIAIARALVNHPDILLADEPTGNLDSINGKEVMKLFIDLHQTMKSTIVIVTHDPEVGKMCDRVLYMHDGKINNQNYKIL